MNEKRYAAITRSDFAKLKEDIQFLDNALKTVCRITRRTSRSGLWMACLSANTRKPRQLNRGSVDYLQKKLLTAMAHSERTG